MCKFFLTERRNLIPQVMFLNVFFAFLVDGSVEKKARIIGAGPLMVMETEVAG